MSPPTKAKKAQQQRRSQEAKDKSLHHTEDKEDPYIPSDCEADDSGSSLSCESLDCSDIEYATVNNGKPKTKYSKDSRTTIWRRNKKIKEVRSSNHLITEYFTSVHSNVDLDDQPLLEEPSDPIQLQTQELLVLEIINSEQETALDYSMQTTNAISDDSSALDITTAIGSPR